VGPNPSEEGALFGVGILKACPDMRVVDILNFIRLEAPSMRPLEPSNLLVIRAVESGLLGGPLFGYSFVFGIKWSSVC